MACGTSNVDGAQPYKYVPHGELRSTVDGYTLYRRTLREEMIMGRHDAKPDKNKPESKAMGNKSNTKRGRGLDQDQVNHELNQQMGRPHKGTGKHLPPDEK